MNIDNVKRDDWIVAGLAVLLIIVLAAFPWFSFSFGPLSFDFTGTDSPDGWLIVLAVIALIALLFDLGLEQFSPQTQVPAINDSRAMNRFVLAAAAGGLMFLKFLFHLGHIGNLGWGFWLGAVVVIALVYFAMRLAGVGGDLGAGIMPANRPGAGRGPGTSGSRPGSESASAAGPSSGAESATRPPAATPAGGPSEPPTSTPPPGA